MVEMHPDVSYRGSDLKDAFYIKTYYQPAGIIQELEPFIQHNTTLTSQNISTDCINNGHSDQQNGHSGTKIVTMDLPVLNKEGKQKDKVFKKTSEKDLILESDHDISTERSSKLLEQENADIVNSELRNNDKDEIRIPSSSHDKDKRQFCLDDIYNSDVVRLIYEKTCQDSIDHQRQLLSDILDMLPNEQFECPSPDESWSSSTGPNVTNNDNTKFDRLCTVLINQTDNKHIYSAKNSNSSFDNYQDRLSVDLSIQSLVEHEVDVLKSETDVKLDCSREDKMTSDSKNNFDKTDSDLINKLIHTPKTLRDDFLMCDVPNLPTETNSQQISCILSYVDFREENGGEAFITSGNFKEKDFISQQEFYDSDEENLQETLSREGEIKTSTPRGEGRTGCSVFDGSDEGISSVTTFPQDINITNEISGAKIDVKSRELMDVDYNSVKFDTSTAVSNKLEHVNGKTQTEREQEYFVCSHDYNKTNADFTEVRNDKTIFSHDSQELFEKNSNEIQDFITYEQISFLNSQTVEPLDISRKQLCLNNQNKTFGENVSFLQQCDNQDGSITSVKTDFGYFCDLDKSFSLQSRHGASDNSLDKSIEESSEMSTSSEIDHFSKVCVSFCPTMTSSADDLEAQTREAACSLMGVYQGNTNVNMADNMSGVIRAYGNSCDPVNGARIPLSATVISDNMEKKLNTPLSCQNSDTINITENNIGSLSEIGTTNQMEQYQNNKVVEEFNNRITSKHITTPTTRVSGKFSRTNISKNSVNFDKSMPKKQPEKISKLVLRDSKSSVLTVSYNGSHISSHIQDGKCFDNAKNTNLNGGKNLDNLNSTMNEDTDLSAQNRDCKFYINEGFTLSSATVNKIFSDKMLVQEQNKMEEKDKTPRNDHTTAAFSVANSDRLQDSAVFICNTQSHSILSESMMKKNEIPNLQNNLMSEFSNLKVQTTNMQANSLSNHSQMKITAGYSTQRAASNWGRLRAQLPQIESTKMTNNSKVKGQPTISCNSPEFNERIVQLRQSAEKFDQARNKQIKGCNSPQLESRFCRVAKAVIVKSKANVMSEIELAEMKINQHKECLPVLSVDLPENLDLNIPKDQNMISENPPLEKPVVNQDKKSKTINKTERRESTKTRSSSFKQKSTKIQSEEEVVSTKHATLTKPKNDERLMENRDSTMTQQKINNPYKSNTSTRITPSTKKSCKPSSTFSRKIPSANKGSNKSTISVIDQLNKPEVTSDHNGQTTEINIVAINDDQVAEMNKIILAIKEGGGKDISEIPEAGKTDDESNQAETCLEVTSLRSQNEEVTSQETEFNLERIFQTNHQDHIIPQSLEEDGKLNRSEDQIVDLLIDENKMHQETESENIMNKNNQVDRETDHNQSVNDEQSSSQTIVNDQPISQKVSMITLIKAPVKAFPQQQPKPTSPQPQIAEIPDVTLQNQDDSSELSEDDPEIKMARLNRFKATKALWKKTIGQLINNAKTPESPEKDQGETDTSRNKLSPGRDKILTIRRSLNERLTTPIMSPIPTRKYLWVKGEGGIWKKEYCDSPQDGSLSPCPGYSHPQSVSPCPFRSPSPSSFLKDVRPDFSSDKISDVKNVRKTLKSPSNISNATDHAQTECSLLVAPEIILNGEDSTLTASKPDMIHGLGIITDEEEITTEEKKLSQVKEMTSENEEGRTLELGGKPSEITKLNLKITERNLEFEEKLIEITEKNAQDDLDVETSDEFEIEPVYENIGASMKMVIKNKNMELAIGEIPENHKTKNDPKNLTERSNNRTSGMLISDVISNTNISLNENMNINTCCDPHLCHDVVSTHVVFHGSKTSNINHTEIQHVSNTELQNKNIMQKVMKDEYSSSDEVCCKDKILDPNNQKQDLAKIPDFQNNIVHRPNILQMQKLNSNFETGSVEIKGREKTHDKGFQSNDVWQGSVEYILESPVVCKLPETKETRISETSIDHHFTELKVVSPDQENVTQQNGTCMSNSSTYRETIAAQNVVVPRRMKKQVKSKNLKLLTEGAVRCPSLVLEESYSDEELLDHEDSKLRKCVVKFDSCKSVYLDNSSSFRQEESSEKGQQCHSVPETENGKVLNEANSHIETTVRLRKSPSPHRERPKSDTTYSVRWADLLEQVREKEETFYTKDGQQIRRKPRPKSDIEDLQQPSNSLNDDDDDDVFCEGGSSLYMSHMRAFLGSIGNLRPCDSLRSLVELRRQHQEYGNKAHKVVKNRRMSTPHPIKSRTDKKQAKGNTNHELVRSHSMPESLDKLHRRKNFLSLIGCDTNSIYSQSGGCDDSSDESEISVDFNHQEKSRNIRGSLLTLQTLDELIKEENMIYAEALWDHVTMDTDEMGFRAGDLVRVTDLVDKDWWFGVIDDRQGWFPATFVRLRVNQAAVEEEMTMTIHEESENVPKLRHHGVSYIDKNQARANVVNEIINAEREYSKHLKDVVEGYVKQARKRPEMFSEEKITTMFGNIEEIYTFASKFHTELEKHINPTFLHLSEIGGTFLDNSKHFEIYSDYCNNHPSACDELKESYRNKRYRHFFEACRLLQDMIEIPLEGFLLTPVQKICKYHLQLAELLKYTPLDHPDHTNVKGALEAMKKIATLINERKRKMESIEKIATWQMSVDTWEGPDLLDISSELIYSGELHKINSSGWSQERYFFLFDHQVVYCKKDILKKNSFCYKGRINLDQCEVIPQEDGKDTQYNVTVRHAWKLHDTGRDKWYLLVAKSDHVKQRWLKAFEDERQRVKDDQENNFNIPAHIREKAIHNVKQKTNLQGSKGKRKMATRSASFKSVSSKREYVSVSAIATLPRKPKRQDSTLSNISQSKKLTWFFLGGKKAK
ncbi:uncharacterized protein LOC126830100 isoform X4 [Patella vulgata]|uniref:uncharacterized protein LOC126830100 isoform X4 n=1 Tax=Patella vulgata TaxID=6465 RepID=UPI0024A99812|nr:uncharacterized protein LOC126830100 isoform X4 [Patella vulgata]